VESPIEAAVRDMGVAYMISVYDDPQPITVEIPSLVPARFVIPPVSISRKELSSYSLSLPRGPVRYLSKHTKEGQEYLLLEIPPALALRYFGTEKQARDEMGNRLIPEVARVSVPVMPQVVAAEIERQCRLHDVGEYDAGYGVIRVRDREPTMEELRRADALNVNRMRWLVAETNRIAAKNPNAAVVTAQARRAAEQLYARGLISSLPEWAVSYEKFTGRCPACNVVYGGSPVRCTSCGAIFDWKRAVEFGIVREADVPASVRAGWQQPVTG
jgi:hypothetical protein